MTRINELFEDVTKLALRFYREGSSCLMYILKGKDKKLLKPLVKELNKFGYKVIIYEDSNGESIFEVVWGAK